MNYQEFIVSITDKITEIVGDCGTVTVNEIRKNNGIVLQGLTIMKKDSNSISPTIYLNEYYEEYSKGEDIETIIDEILFLYKKANVDVDFDIEEFTDFEKMKDHIAYKLVNYEKNKELLQDIPHVVYLDLAIVFYCLMSEDTIGNATILIYNTHMSMWNTDTQTLYETAKKNTPKLLDLEIKNMVDVLLEDLSEKTQNTDAKESITKDFWESDDSEEMREQMQNTMFVMTNRARFYGASVMLYNGVLKAFAEKMEKNLYILPSSIHEVILLPEETNIREKELAKMVRDINATVLECQEILSDHVYYYSREEDCIVLSA